jgi:hypothetical protein
MSSLMQEYLKKYGGETTEKKAAADDPGKLLADLFSTDEGQEKKAEAEKLAAVYDELGRRLARETFAAEQLGLTEEKTAEEKGEEKGAEKTASADDPAKMLLALLQPEKEAEKTAATKEDDGFGKFLEAITGGEEKTAEQAELEKYAALGEKLAMGFLAGKKDLIAGIMKRVGGLIRAGSTKAKAVASGFYQHVKGAPGASAALATGGAAAGYGAARATQ